MQFMSKSNFHFETEGVRTNMSVKRGIIWGIVYVREGYYLLLKHVN